MNSDDVIETHIASEIGIVENMPGKKSEFDTEKKKPNSLGREKPNLVKKKIKL